jgi:CBS domain containing-hemolysin-like protein
LLHVEVLTKAKIVAKAREENMAESVVSTLTTDIPQVALTDPLETVLDHLQRPEIPAVAVISTTGQFIGYVSRENIGEWAVLSKRRYD